MKPKALAGLAIGFFCLMMSITGTIFFTMYEDPTGSSSGGGSSSSGGGSSSSGGGSSSGKLTDYETNFDEDGGGKAIYLDRQTVECRNGALNQFRLRRHSDHERVHYKYKCIDGVIGEGEEKSTPADDIDHGKNKGAIYIDRHDVDCGNKPVRKFKLTRPSSDELAYEYTCGNKEAGSTCRDVKTGSEPMNDMHYFDRHDVKCDSSEYLTRFKLVNRGGGKWSYDYKCCKN